MASVSVGLIGHIGDTQMNNTETTIEAFTEHTYTVTQYTANALSGASSEDILFVDYERCDTGGAGYTNPEATVVGYGIPCFFYGLTGGKAWPPAEFSGTPQNTYRSGAIMDAADPVDSLGIGTDAGLTPGGAFTFATSGSQIMSLNGTLASGVETICEDNVAVQPAWVYIPQGGTVHPSGTAAASIWAIPKQGSLSGLSTTSKDILAACLDYVVTTELGLGGGGATVPLFLNHLRQQGIS